MLFKITISKILLFKITFQTTKGQKFSKKIALKKRNFKKWIKNFKNSKFAKKHFFKKKCLKNQKKSQKNKNIPFFTIKKIIKLKKLSHPSHF